MRKGSRMVTKKVFIPEENEEEKYKKVEAKKVMVRAEFEKHKKELMLDASDTSKANEIRLKNQLEALMNSNEQKLDKLKRLEKAEEALEKNNSEATFFYEAISKLEASRESDAYLSIGFHPNRTTTTMFGVTHGNLLESLSDKKGQLVETLANIELLIEQENEATTTTIERYEQLKKDQTLLKKKVHELEKMNDHAGKRFTDLQKIEFLAMNSHAASASTLKEAKDEMREIKNQEMVYKKQKESDKKKELEHLHAKQAEISNLLVDLDRKREEDLQKQEELKKLEILHNEIKLKRKNNKIVTKYIELFNALQGEKKLNLGAIDQILKDIAEQLDTPRDASSNKPSSHEGSKRSPSGSRGNSPKRQNTQTSEENQLSPTKKNSSADRNFYVERIQRFYERYPEGPEKLADSVIKKYLDQCYREESLKGSFEEMESRKKKQENELQRLEKELENLKAINEYLVTGKTGSKILDSNEREAIDSGMLIVNRLPTTLSQAKFDFEHEKEVDREIDLLNATEAFVLRCYFDSVEMMTRFSKVLHSIHIQSGGAIPSDLKEISRVINAQLLLLKREKKANQQLEVSRALSDGNTDFHITNSEFTGISEKDQEAEARLDLQEITDIFLGIFDGYTNEASEFVNIIKNDVVISAFITIDDIKKYLQTFQKEVYIEVQLQRVLSETIELREAAIANMSKKFEILYKLYNDLMPVAQQATDQTCRRLQVRGIDAEVEDLGRRDSEPNAFVDKAVEKKWKALMEKYDYDPGRDFRKETIETETSDREENYYFRENFFDDGEAAEKEQMDTEDLKSKLNDIVGTGLGKSPVNKQFNNTKTLFKTKNQEEKRKLQLKREKEKKKKIAMENMTDDEFLDYQRSQIKKEVKEEVVIEKKESDLRRKAQEDLAQRLSPTLHLDELKRMIGNSKILSKIQILEKQKFVADERRVMGLNLLENYVPLEPKKIAKSPLNRSSSQEYKIRISRKAQTPTDRYQRSRFYQDPSERTSEVGVESPKDSFQRAITTKFTSKFKPQDMFDPTISPIQPNARPFTQGSKRLRLQMDGRKWPNDKTEESLRASQDKSVSAIIKKSQSPSGHRRKKLVVHAVQSASKVSASGDSSMKMKQSQSDYPRLDKSAKKEEPEKKKRILNSAKVPSTEHGHLYQLLSSQTDPRLKMVYAPNFFTGSPQNAILPIDLINRSDPYPVIKNSGILVPEKL